MKALKTLSLCAALMTGIAAVPAMPVTVFAEDAAATSGACGENLTWEFDKTTGTLTITGTGAMRAPEYDGDFLFGSLSRSEIKKVVMDYGVTKITQGAFTGCRNLTSVSIPDSVENIEFGIFYDCESLTEISLPLRLTKISDSAFKNCTSLTSVFISNKVTAIDYGAFEGCTGLSKITIMNPECKIYDIAFTISETAVIAGYDGSTAQVYAEKYGRTFESLGEAPAKSGKCGENLTWEFDEATGTLTISGTGDMYNWSQPFMSSDHIPAWSDWSEVIKAIVIEEGVTSIGNYAFVGVGGEMYHHITKLELPSTLEYIGISAFMYASVPTEEQMQEPMVILGNVLYAVNDPGETVVIPDGIKGICSGVLKETNVKEIQIPESVVRIGADAFADTPWMEAKQKESPFVVVNGILLNGKNCEGNVTVPEGVTSIGDYAFNTYHYGEEGTNKLTGITIPEGVTSIGNGAFYDCAALREVNLPESLKVIGDGAFEMFYCIDKETPQLEKITIPAGVEELGEWAFNKCKSLREVTILNPECRIGELAINNSIHSKSEDWESPDYNVYIPDYAGVIRGYDGSTAEAYAKKWGFTFESLGKAPATIPDLPVTLRGDVYCDNIVDVSDAVILARFLTGDKIIVTDQGLANADADANGKLETDDILQIVRIVVGLPV